MENIQFNTLIDNLKTKDVNFFEVWSKKGDNYTLKLIGFAKNGGKDHIFAIFQIWDSHGYEMFIQHKGINITNDVYNILNML